VETDVPQKSTDSKGPRKRLSARVGVIAFAIMVLMVATAIAWSGCRVDDPTTLTPVPDPVPTTTTSLKSVEGQVGEPVDTGSFLFEVLSAGPSELPQVSPRPEPGHYFLGVNVRVVNQGESGVPLNGLPYRAPTAALQADGIEYPGGLYISPAGALRDGTVPPGVPITFQFVFEIPDDSREATFTWAPVPAVTGYPKIVVALPPTALRRK